MRGGPYRMPAATGCDHARGRPGVCELCGKPCCSECAEDSVCALCLLRAFQAVKWTDGVRRRGSGEVLTKVWVLVGLSLWVASAAAIKSAASHERANTTVETANPV